MKTKILLFSLLAATHAAGVKAQGCTGITVRTESGGVFPARTFEWAEGYVDPKLKIVKRSSFYRANTPQGGGMSWKGKYGYVGITSGDAPYVNEGLNEKGLSAGVFFFPGFASYAPFDPKNVEKTISELDFTAYVLSMCATVDDVREALGRITVTGVFQSELGGAPQVHWRVVDASGHGVVVEITGGGRVDIYENTVGVLTNSPQFPWHLTNLRNYLELKSAPASPMDLGGEKLTPLGSGSGMLGMPGDYTPPSRFVRAAFLLNNSRPARTAYDAVVLGFHILNNFDIPLSAEIPPENAPDMPSATQWTSLSDVAGRVFYYRTMYDCAIRKIDFARLDFSPGNDITAPLDEKLRQDFKDVVIDAAGHASASTAGRVVPAEHIIK